MGHDYLTAKLKSSHKPRTCLGLGELGIKSLRKDYLPPTGTGRMTMGILRNANAIGIIVILAMTFKGHHHSHSGSSLE